MRKTIVLVTTLLAFLLLLPRQVAAQLDVDFSEVGLQPIEFPSFFSLDYIQNFSLWSYVGLLISVTFFGVMLLWIYLILQGAFSVLRSQGEEGMIEGGKKKITNVMISVSMLFFFLVGVTVVAAFFGVGNFWEWPKTFSICNGNEKYYFQYALEQANTNKTTEQIENECFNAARRGR